MRGGTGLSPWLLANLPQQKANWRNRNKSRFNAPNLVSRQRPVANKRLKLQKTKKKWPETRWEHDLSVGLKKGGLGAEESKLKQGCERPQRDHCWLTKEHQGRGVAVMEGKGREGEERRGKGEEKGSTKPSLCDRRFPIPGLL